MSFKQWRHYLKNVSEIKVWLNHANLKQFMSQIVLNNHQACWLIQLISYDFIIQYCWDILNSANESSWKLNYMMMKQNKKYHENVEKLYKLNLKQFWLISIQSSNSNLIFIEDKLTFWQIDDLISILVNKLAIATFKISRQYNYYIRETDSEMKCLIQILSLQAITWSKIRLTANNLMSYKETLNSLSQKTVSLNIFINKSILYSSFNFSEKNITILKLIKNIQEFNSQCR